MLFHRQDLCLHADDRIEAVVNGMKATSCVRVTVRKPADVTRLKFLIEQIWLLMVAQEKKWS
jgi:hypothetical protein